MGADRDFDAFLFHVERWFASITQQRMLFVEKGVYLVMMFQQWRARSRNLPDSPEAIADLIANTEAQAAEVIAAWPVVRRKFVTSKHDDARIYNVEIEHTRRAQRKKRRETSDAARHGGKASAAKRLAHKELPSNGRSTAVQPPSTDRGKRVSKKKKKNEEPRAEPSSPPFVTFPVVGGKAETWDVTEAALADWTKAYPGLDLRGEIRKALVWVQANPSKRKTPGGMPNFLVRWFSRATNEGRGRLEVSPAAAALINGCFHDPPCESASAHTRKQLEEQGLAS